MRRRTKRSRHEDLTDLASQLEAVRGQPATLIVWVAVAGAITRLALAASLTAATSHLSAQPSIKVRDSIVLQESGDDYLVLPPPSCPDGSGGYLVADAGPPGVFHYSGNGRLMRRYGRAGEGAGEGMDANVTLPWGDDTSWSCLSLRLPSGVERDRPGEGCVDSPREPDEDGARAPGAGVRPRAGDARCGGRLGGGGSPIVFVNEQSLGSERLTRLLRRHRIAAVPHGFQIELSAFDSFTAARVPTVHQGGAGQRASSP